LIALSPAAVPGILSPPSAHDPVRSRALRFPAGTPEGVERQPHDIEVVALDPGHEEPAESLDSVGPGLVHRLAGLEIELQRRPIERLEVHPGALDRGRLTAAAPLGA